MHPFYRYQGGHAASHYRETGHCYALQLGSHRVWDYKGENIFIKTFAAAAVFPYIIGDL